MKHMKHLMRYGGYTSKERLDDILDKISKYGISSLSKDERSFLDSHESGQEETVHSELVKKESETVFEDDSGNFKFELDYIDEDDDEAHYFGTLYVPDLQTFSGQTIEGRLKGRITFYKNSGQSSPDFFSDFRDPKTKDRLDVFEFCSGLEYELDAFIDYVISELQTEEN